MKELFIKLLDLRCLLCNSPLKNRSQCSICDSCYNEITSCKTLYCNKCAEKLYSDTKCSCSKKSRSSIDSFKFIANYEGRGKQLVLSLKKQGNAQLLSVYNRLIIDHLDKDIPVMIVPDNLITKYFRGNASLENGLGRLLKQNGFTVIKGFIHKASFAKKQKLSHIKERVQNAQKNFTSKKQNPSHNKSIQLIDDIYTTGSTINRCASLLTKLGYTNISALTIFRTPFYELGLDN